MINSYKISMFLSFKTNLFDFLQNNNNIDRSGTTFMVPTPQSLQPFADVSLSALDPISKKLVSMYPQCQMDG